ncbi:hypothetical protein KO465_07500 [Candidatus Micrarchaeota archaeon]|nr:hypothetical protein [Candidatus Micrarchaeota archaeon]
MDMKIFNVKKAIVIGTRPDRKDQLENCLSSIKTDYPVLVVDCDGYEMGKIYWTLLNTDVDEFIFLQDTVEIKNNDLFKICFEDFDKSVSICNSPRMFGCYMGKFKRSILERMALKPTQTKLSSVEYEMQIGDDYSNFEMPIKLFDNLGKTDKFIEKWGHKVMVIENEYLIKYKSIWNRNML